ncbi:uncharacterized protein V6R79_008493 [Siganus canaliculatus]
MDAEDGPLDGPGQRDRKRPYTMEQVELEDLEESNTKKLYKGLKGLLSKRRAHSGNVGAEAKLSTAESSTFIPAGPVCVFPDKWGVRGVEDIQDELLYSCCPAEGSLDQSSPSTMLEYWVCLGNQHNMADDPATGSITPPATPANYRSCPFVCFPGPITVSTVSPRVGPEESHPAAEAFSPFRSMCTSPTRSAWDALKYTSRNSVCSEQDPVSAAAHLHLLGESLSLIGCHLQETDKLVCTSSSLSLLLDSMLCALVPLVCLTTEIPELRSCTQHTLASTLENIAYVMPGMIHLLLPIMECLAACRQSNLLCECMPKKSIKECAFMCGCAQNREWQDSNFPEMNLTCAASSQMSTCSEGVWRHSSGH